MLGVLNDQIGSILGPHAFTDVLNWDSQALLRCDAWIAHGTSRIRTLSRHASSIYRHDIAGKTSQDGASREAQLPKRRTSPQRVLKLITRPEVLLPSILALVAQYANWGTTFSLNPILAKQLGATDVTLSLILSMNALAIGLGSLAATMLANKVGARAGLYWIRAPGQRHRHRGADALALAVFRGADRHRVLAGHQLSGVDGPLDPLCR